MATNDTDVPADVAGDAAIQDSAREWSISPDLEQLKHPLEYARALGWSITGIAVVAVSIVLEILQA